MAGCFGNSSHDRFMQRQLDAYLDDGDLFICEECGHHDSIGDLEEDIGDDDALVCPICYPNGRTTLKEADAEACIWEDYIAINKDGVEILISKTEFELLKKLAKGLK